MRIGLHTGSGGLGELGGAQVYVRDLLRALAEDVSANEYVVLLGRDHETPPGVGMGRVTAARLPPAGLPPGLRTSLWRFRQTAAAAFGPWHRGPNRPSAVDRLGLDLVHYAATSLMLPLPATPFVVTVQDVQDRFYPEFFSATARFRRRLALRAAVRRARLVLVPSAFTRQSLIDLGLAPADRTVVVPPGISERFQPLGPSADDEMQRDRLGLPTQPFLLFPANPWSHKNHERLFRAVRMASQTLGCTVPVVCTGRLKGVVASSASLARAIAPDVPVHDLGFVPEAAMPVLYRAARVMAFPSLFEGFGLPVFEAMASGCPVACSRATALAELEEDAVRFFDPLDEADMARAIVDIWTDGPVRQSTIARGLIRVTAFRWPAVLPTLLSAYRQASGVTTCTP